MYEKYEQTAHYIRQFITEQTPEFAIILGSGLSSLQGEVTPIVEIPYAGIPNFPQSTVEGHGNKLIYGTLAGKYVLLMSGRFHYYEGYPMQEVTFPIRIFHLLGIKKLIVSNASGGVNPDFSIGDIMLIRDHINMFPEHPLRGKNLEKFGTRFPDMSEAYDRSMIALAEDIAKEQGTRSLCRLARSYLRNPFRIWYGTCHWWGCRRDEYRTRGNRSAPSGDEGLCPIHYLRFGRKGYRP